MKNETGEGVRGQIRMGLSCVRSFNCFLRTRVRAGGGEGLIRKGLIRKMMFIK